MTYRIGQLYYDNNPASFTGEAKTERENNIIINNNISEDAKNLFSYITANYGNIKALQRLGVRSRPGALMALNDEIIQIGRSGRYEVFSDLIYIYDIKVLTPDVFIFDFRY